MNFKVLLITILFSLNVLASENVSQTILKEYRNLRDYVSKLKPDSTEFEIFHKKQFDGYILLWKLGKGGRDGDVIRFYREGKTYGEGFSIDYITGTHFIAGQEVVRRFVGFEKNVWRNHTVDLKDGFHYGSQGASQLYLESFDLEILKKWKITLFPRN